VNVQPDQVKPVTDYFAMNGLGRLELHPTIRGRLLEVNGRPIKPEAYADQRTRRLAEREFNLSYGERLPAHNHLAAGRWFEANDFTEGALSVEEGLANKLGLRIGDMLSWSVAGERFSAPITNLRKLEWDSMQVNFFVISTPSLLRDLPTS
jgi:putative ABC transport system permease protein